MTIYHWWLKINVMKYFLILIIVFAFCLTGCTRKSSVECACNKINTPSMTISQEQVETWDDLNRKVIQLYREGQIQHALKTAEEAAKFGTNTFGPSDIRVASSLNNLGEVYRVLHRYLEAEACYKKALEIQEKVLGKNHIDVASSLNNLGTVYYSLQNYPLSESFYLQAIRIIKGQNEEINNAKLEIFFSNLGELYKVSNKYLKAEEVYKTLLSIREKTRGKEDPLYAKSLNDLGAVYFLQGKYKEAETLFNTTLVTLEKTLGKNNPEIAVALDNIAEFYRRMGDPVKAKSFEDRARSLKKGRELPT